MIETLKDKWVYYAVTVIIGGIILSWLWTLQGFANAHAERLAKIETSQEYSYREVIRRLDKIETKMDGLGK